jgi:hypothetical protein
VTAATESVHLEREIRGVGTLQFVQSEKRREYWLLPEGGERRRRIPSVTTILRKTWPKPELLAWYAREGSNVEAVLAEAAARGTNAHTFVETFMRTGDLMPFDSFPEDHHGYLQGVARFLFDYAPEPIAVERLVVHPELNYAGRLDLIATLDDEPGLPTLLDFKTNPKGRIYPEAHVQGHAYALADERCGEPRVGRVALVGIAEDGTYRFQLGADASKIWGACQDMFKTMARFEKELEKVGA